LILGGARSGKTAHALSLALQPRTYVATAEALDDEMEARIARHKAERGEDWGLIEAPLDLPGALRDSDSDGKTLVVDCLTLWLSNLIHNELDVAKETARLASVMSEAQGTLIFVSNEIGLGLVPMESLSRRFRDEQGWLNQRIAAICDRVEFIAAGLPIRMK